MKKQQHNISNYRVLNKMIYTIYDEYAPKYISADQIKGVRYDLIHDYLTFVDDITRMDENLLKSKISILQEDYNFAKKVLSLSERYSKIGEDAFIDGADEFFVKMMKAIKSWVMKDGLITFREVEKSYYSQLAFSKDTTESPETTLQETLNKYKNEKPNNDW